jgi:hypothetical protein
MCIACEIKPGLASGMFSENNINGLAGEDVCIRWQFQIAGSLDLWTAASSTVCAAYNNAQFKEPIIYPPCQSNTLVGCYNNITYSGWRVWRVKSMHEDSIGCVIRDIKDRSTPLPSYQGPYGPSWAAQCNSQKTVPKCSLPTNRELANKPEPRTEASRQ